MTDSWRWAALFPRVIVGLIFGMAGFWKVFTLTPMGHAQRFFTGPYADSWIPYWMLVAAGVTVPFIELIAGWLLVFGLFRRPAAIALGFVLVLVTYGHLLKEALYSPQGHIFPRTVLLFPTLVLSVEQDPLSLDYLLLRRRKKLQGA
jgi:thiosulfate dehydrogenase (quinone) large subunit